MPHRLLARLREAVATSTMPQLQRPEEKVRETDYSTKQRVELAKKGRAIPVRNKQGEIVSGRYPINTANDVHNAVMDFGRSGGGAQEKAHIIKVAKEIGATAELPAKWAGKKAREAAATPLRVLVREAVTKAGNAFEATIIREGPGNPSDKHYYTREALRKAVSDGMFEGLQAYANHPSASEERDRPERDVRALVGHFREARYVEDGGRAAVKAKFVPINGPGYEWVTSLIESALAAPAGRPLVGISIDGHGHAPDQQEINGRTYSMVREVTHLGSADIVTRAGAGGEFHRRLQEAWRNTTPGQIATGSQEDRMKPAKLQEKIQTAVANLEKAASMQDDDKSADELVEGAISSLRECASAEIKLPKAQIREVAVPASDSTADDLAAKLREAEQALITEKKRRKDAEEKLAEVEAAKVALKVLSEKKVPDRFRESWFPELVALGEELAMADFIERKLGERDAYLADFQESVGVEGAGVRIPIRTGTSGGDLLDVLGIDKDELAA